MLILHHSLLRFRSMDDDRGDKEETPDHMRTDDEHDHTDEETIQKQLRTLRTSTKPSTINHATQKVNQRKTRPRPTHKTPTSMREATKTPTTTFSSTAYQKTM